MAIAALSASASGGAHSPLPYYTLRNIAERYSDITFDSRQSIIYDVTQGNNQNRDEILPKYIDDLAETGFGILRYANNKEASIRYDNKSLLIAVGAAVYIERVKRINDLDEAFDEQKLTHLRDNLKLKNKIGHSLKAAITGKHIAYNYPSEVVMKSTDHPNIPRSFGVGACMEDEYLKVWKPILDKEILFPVVSNNFELTFGKFIIHTMLDYLEQKCQSQPKIVTSDVKKAIGKVLRAQVINEERAYKLSGK
ncbi:MAG: hypothetical protein NVSMB46_04800 [Candidatus Saccharimonadales bacterium]